MTNYTYSLLLLLTFFTPSCSQHKSVLQQGDLLFQDLNCGDLCDAIENATLGKNGERFSHVAIVVKENNQFYVIEAYDGVSKTPLAEFLNRDLLPNEKHKVVLGRLKKEFQQLIPKAIEQANMRIGLEYDNEFKLNNNKYYCSEFIYDIFKENAVEPIFKVKPMTFKNKKTGAIDSAWVDYFNKQDIPIPEGELGCNPIDYYESNKLMILGSNFNY